MSAGAATLATGSTVGNLTLANGSITDSGGSIDFDNENLTTTSTVTAEQLTTTDIIGFIITTIGVFIATRDKKNG